MKAATQTRVWLFAVMGLSLGGCAAYKPRPESEIAAVMVEMRQSAREFAEGRRLVNEARLANIHALADQTAATRRAVVQRITVWQLAEAGRKKDFYEALLSATNTADTALERELTRESEQARAAEAVESKVAIDHAKLGEAIQLLGELGSAPSFADRIKLSISFVKQTKDAVDALKGQVMEEDKGMKTKIEEGGVRRIELRGGGL